SVWGDLRCEGGRGRGVAASVCGEVVVVGGAIPRGDLGTTSGGIRFAAALAPGARIEATSTSGEVELILPEDVSADFEVSTFSGDIRNDFGPQAKRTSHYTSEKELTFTIGSGAARVTATSFSGDVYLRRAAQKSTPERKP
ncbi:MAG: DUF4097 family beta strand repeat-containing protein, partial [Acidobacteriota bacterium]